MISEDNNRNKEGGTKLNNVDHCLQLPLGKLGGRLGHMAKGAQKLQKKKKGCKRSLPC